MVPAEATAGEVILLVLAHPLVRVVLGLLGANVLAGVAAACYTRTFRLGLLGDWLRSRALPYILGAGSMQVVVLTVPASWSGVSTGLAWSVWLFVIASLVGHLLEVLRSIGLPLPEALGDAPRVRT